MSEFDVRITNEDIDTVRFAGEGTVGITADNCIYIDVEGDTVYVNNTDINNLILALQKAKELKEL